VRALGASLAPLLACGCLHVNEVGHDDMPSHFQYDGFSFERPANPAWHYYRSESSPTDVIVRRELDSRTHSFFVRIAWMPLDHTPATHEEFVELFHQPVRDQPPESDIQATAEPAERQGQWCARTHLEATVTHPPRVPDQVLRLVVAGYACLSRARPRQALVFMYSERGLPAEIDPALQAEGADVVEHVVLESSPGVPLGKEVE
jgi:hypothetical protein